ncbi:MAG: hypothetical protein AB1753_05270, partial [Thermoproteota archaeon]
IFKTARKNLFLVAYIINPDSGITIVLPQKLLDRLRAHVDSRPVSDARLKELLSSGYLNFKPDSCTTSNNSSSSSSGTL